jgi:hypothetical protein
MHPIDATHDWIAGHPVATMIGLFCFGSLISIYGSEVKRFLHTWPAHQYRAGSRTRSYRRLALLQMMHKDSYELVLYLASTTFGSMNMSVLIYWISILISVWNGHGIPRPAWSIYAGIWLARWYESSIIVWQLQNYDYSVSQLNTKIANREAKLALKQP